MIWRAPSFSRRTWLTLAGWTLTLMSLGRPRWGSESVPVSPAAGTLWIIVDVSRSMLALDAPGNRLEHAKRLALGLLDAPLPGRVGLVAYAGRPTVVCPPTVDAETLRRFVGELAIASAPAGGSDWTAALELLAGLPRTDARQVDLVLLLTDGGGTDKDLSASIAAARSAGLVVAPVGIGRPDADAVIPLPEGGPLIERGEPVLTRLVEAPLRRLAAETDGVYVPARDRPADLADLARRVLLPLQNRVRVERFGSRPAERFQWLLLPGLILLLWASARPARSGWFDAGVGGSQFTAS